MKFDLFVLIIIFEHLINVNPLIIGKMNSVSFYLPSWSPRLMNAFILNATCEECLCTILTNSSNFNSLDIGSFNCFDNNKTCQLFSKGTFYQYWLNNDTNTTYYFLQEPTMMDSSDLVAWHSFDGGSYNDSSGNSLNAIQVVNVLSVPGRINDAIYFYSNTSVYQIGGFTSLGQSSTPYSVALWVQPTVLRESPLIHLSAGNDGQGWCIDMFGFLTNGQIVARCWQGSPVITNGSILAINAWHHLTTVYSPSIGLQLYINGTLIDQSGSFNYLASTASDYITLASSLLSQTSSACASDMIARSGTFDGLIDELRVYARAISPDDIYALANP